MARTRPRSRASTRARHASTNVPCWGLGQWMRYRSIASSPVRNTLSSIVRSAASYSWWRPGSLLVTITSERGTDALRAAWPTAPSFS